MMEWIQYLGVPIALSLLLVVVLLTGFAYLSYFERKTVARFTIRSGPNRAGPYGIFQPLADGLKMAFKEELLPSNVDKVVYVLAPGVAVSTAIMTWAVLPVAAKGLEIFGIVIPPFLADVNVGMLYILAIGSLGSYGIVFAAWSSNNKYSLLGGLRTAAQMISYELPMGVILATLLMIVGSMNINRIVDYQVQNGWLMFFFPLGPFLLLVFFITMLAEANRSPFDFPETENELVSGFLTEYGGIKFALFFMGEYIHMITLSALTATLFFGGWHGPFAERFPILGLVYLAIKVVFMLFMMIWVRASIPRPRYDQLMQFCWKFLLPVTLVMFVIAALRILLWPSIPLPLIN